MAHGQEDAAKKQYDEAMKRVRENLNASIDRNALMSEENIRNVFPGLLKRFDTYEMESAVLEQMFPNIRVALTMKVKPKHPCRKEKERHVVVTLSSHLTESDLVLLNKEPIKVILAGNPDTFVGISLENAIPFTYQLTDTCDPTASSLLKQINESVLLYSIPSSYQEQFLKDVRTIGSYMPGKVSESPAPKIENQEPKPETKNSYSIICIGC